MEPRRSAGSQTPLCEEGEEAQHIAGVQCLHHGQTLSLKSSSLQVIMKVWGFSFLMSDTLLTSVVLPLQQEPLSAELAVTHTKPLR